MPKTGSALAISVPSGRVAGAPTTATVGATSVKTVTSSVFQAGEVSSPSVAVAEMVERPSRR